MVKAERPTNEVNANLAAARENCGLLNRLFTAEDVEVRGRQIVTVFRRQTTAWSAWVLDGSGPNSTTENRQFLRDEQRNSWILPAALFLAVAGIISFYELTTSAPALTTD